MGLTEHFAEVSKMVEEQMGEEGRWVGRFGEVNDGEVIFPHLW